MAKLSITLDTESGDYDVSVDGEKLSNVASIDVCFPNECYWGCYGVEKPFFSITEMTEKEGGVKKIVRTCANKDNPTAILDVKTGLYITSTVEPNRKTGNVLEEVFKCDK